MDATLQEVPLGIILEGGNKSSGVRHPKVIILVHTGWLGHGWPN